MIASTCKVRSVSCPSQAIRMTTLLRQDFPAIGKSKKLIIHPANHFRIAQR